MTTDPSTNGRHALSRIRQDAVDAAGIGIVTVARDGRIRYMDKGAFRIFGLRERIKGPKAAAGLLLSELMQQEFPPPEMWKTEIAPTVLREVHIRFKSQTGHTKWVTATATLEHNASVCAIVLRDITDRKLTEEAHRKSERKFQEAFQASPDGAIIARMGDGRVHDVSKRFGEMLGYPAETIVGCVASELQFWAKPGDRQRFLEQLRNKGICTNFETTLTAQDGRPVRVVLFGRSIEIENEWYVLITVKDVTEAKRAEEQLRESERLYRGLVENATDMIVETDINGRFIYANPGAIYWMGYSMEEVLRMHYLDVIRPDARESVRTLLQNQFDQRIPTVYHEFPAVKKDGSTNWLGQNVRLIMDNNRVTRIHAVSRDITERKLAEEALERAKAEWERTFDAVPDFIMLLDNEGRILRVNQAMAHQLGMKPGDTAGHFCHQLVHRDKKPPAFCPRNAMLANGSESVIEMALDTFGGDYIVTTSPLLDPEGRMAGCVHVARDITERKRAEQALQVEHDFVSDVLNTVGTMVVVLDIEGRFAHFNRMCEQLSGYRSDEVIGKSMLEIAIPPEEHERVSNDFQNLLKAEFQPQNYETHWLTRDGRRRLISWSASALYNEDGSLRYVIGAGLDITEAKAAEEERQRLEAQFQHAQKLESLGILAGGIAHDFNNLLMGILGYAEITLMDLPENNDLREGVLQIQVSAKRAAELTKQMLAYSGKGRFIIEPLDLSQLVEEMANLLSVSISKKVSLTCELAPALPAIEADPSQVRQIVMNLITNASDAIGEKSGVITIRTAVHHVTREDLRDMYLSENLPEADYVMLEVNDTGNGMTREVLERIFDPFFTTKFSGRGLGLAAVMGIVRGHHGAISVKSTPGAGTAFKILLPISPKKIQKGLPEPKPTAAEWDSNTTVLVIDDESAVRSLAKRMLQRRGLKVLTAVDGADGIEMYKKNREKIALVMLDMTMPRMGGEETFRELRALNPKLPIVLCSGYSEEDVAARFAGKELAGFLQKPYQAASLLEMLRTILKPAK